MPPASRHEVPPAMPRSHDGPEPAVTTAPDIPSPSSLVAETAHLDRAREALAGGDWATCLQRVTHYEATFPKGVLRPEATLLRIEALVRAGDRVTARRLARAFAEAHPSSPHLDRLDSLLGP